MISLTLSIVALIVSVIALVKALNASVPVTRVVNIVDANGTIRATINPDGTVTKP